MTLQLIEGLKFKAKNSKSKEAKYEGNSRVWQHPTDGGVGSLHSYRLGENNLAPQQATASQALRGTGRLKAGQEQEKQIHPTRHAHSCPPSIIYPRNDR